MGRYEIKQSKLAGDIFIPPSKSQTLRSILFGALGKGKSVIHGYLHSPDTEAMIHACRSWGAEIQVLPERLEICGLNGSIPHAEDVINAGNSGIVLRFCTAVGALSRHPVVITGDFSIRHQRPMQPLIDGLLQLGVSAWSMRGDGYAPIVVRGPLKSGTTIVSGEDSQHVSALIIASAFAEGPISITVNNPGEKPWVALTLSWLDKLGIPYKNFSFGHYALLGSAAYDGFEYCVPGDLSSAAFPVAAALVTQSELLLRNVDMSDMQGDKELITAFRKMGASIEIDEINKTLFVRKGTLSGIEVDINNFIDAVTILAVVACFAEGETRIQNAAIAKKKECDRLHCIVNELRKMGADIHEIPDGLLIKGSPLIGVDVLSHNDHRMAMSLAVAAMGAEGKTSVLSVDCVAKTFPSFAQEFSALGARLEESK
jgi:3-phosphoshikimate 1-carboxyvinyltransferase